VLPVEKRLLGDRLARVEATDFDTVVACVTSLIKRS